MQRKIANICSIDKTLYPYQQDSKKSIFNKWDSIDDVLFQMPTGTGKTRLFTSIISDIIADSIKRKVIAKILIIAHRTELIDQIDASLKKYRIPHGVIAGSTQRDIKMPVQVASIQTLTNRHNKELAESLNFDFIIIDEAHHSQANSYRCLWTLYPNSKKLGVTATPWRMSNNGFTDLFKELIVSKSPKEFIKEGYLSNYLYYSIVEDSEVITTVSNIKEFDIDGDYKISALESGLDHIKIRSQLVKSYQQYANGKKGIIYSISRKHSEHICEEYRKIGVNIVCIDSDTSKTDRENYVKEFKAGKIQIIVNVDIFSEGFDCPDIEFVQLARPTKSLVKYLQQVGRCLRRNENKEKAIILDNVNLVGNFGLPDIDRNWQYYFVGVPKGTRGSKCYVYEKPLYNDLSYTEGDEEMALVEDYEEVKRRYEEIRAKLEEEKKERERREAESIPYFFEKNGGMYFPELQDHIFEERTIYVTEYDHNDSVEFECEINMKDNPNYYMNRYQNQRGDNCWRRYLNRHYSQKWEIYNRLENRKYQIRKMKDGYSYLHMSCNNDILYRCNGFIIDYTGIRNMNNNNITSQWGDLIFQTIEIHEDSIKWNELIFDPDTICDVVPKIQNIKTLHNIPRQSNMYDYIKSQYVSNGMLAMFRDEIHSGNRLYTLIANNEKLVNFDDSFRLINELDIDPFFCWTYGYMISHSMPIPNHPDYVFIDDNRTGYVMRVLLMNIRTLNFVFLYKPKDSWDSYCDEFSFKETGDGWTSVYQFSNLYEENNIGKYRFNEDDTFEFLSTDGKKDIYVSLPEMTKLRRIKKKIKK